MKPKHLILLVLLLALAFPATTQAQAPSTRFERISIEQGLSQVTIYCIFQDSRGLMWFGTEDGLNKYDGYTFTVYKRDPADPHSLSANTIRAIHEDASGALWIGTDGGGLDRFDRATEQFTCYQNDPDDPDSLSCDTVTAIHEDAAGTLWVGTDGGGLDQLERATGQFFHHRHDPDDPHSLSHDAVTSIVEDSSGRLWVATRGGGLNRLVPSAGSGQALSPAEGLDRATGQFAHYRHDPNDSNSLSHDEINALFAGQDGTLWIGTNDGLNALDPQAQKFTRYLYDPDDPHSLSHEQAVAIYEDSSGTLWAGTPSGLNELVPSAGPGQALGEAEGMARQQQGFVRYYNDPRDPGSLSQDDISALYEDSAGVLWIGTYLVGLNKLDRKARRFVHYRNDPDNPASLGSNTIWAIRQGSAGDLWVGSSGSTGGLDQLGHQTGQFTHYRHDPEDPHSPPAAAAMFIYEDSAGALWVGFYEGGLSRFDRQSGQFVYYRHVPADPDSLSDDTVWAIYEDSAGVFWVGTMEGGLNRFDRETGRFSHYRNDPADPHTLSSNAVPAIYEDASGTLWIGTDDGLNRLDQAAGTFTHYTEKDGLANDAIACILEDDRGYLWISSGKGLSRFDPGTEEFKNYDVRDGLQSNEFNRGACDQNKRGEMFFGGVNGFNVFDPAQISDNPHVPPVILTGFQIFNKPVAIGDASPLKQSIGETEEIILSYRDYVFSFEFAALDYTIPSKNQYAYKLEGFDQEWNTVDSSRRFASYANLPAGDYTLRVKGSNNDGVWNEDGTSIQITVTPPPWKTWWAYTLYALLGISVAAAYLRYRTRELERKHLEQTMWAVQSERDRIAALLESRRQLVASISHDLRTPVAVVRGHLESASANKTFEVLETSKVSLDVVLQELDRLQALLDDLFTLSRLEVDKLALRLVPTDVVAVARRAVEAMAAPAWQQGKVEVALEAAEAELWAVADEQRLLQVLMNLLHNGVRHTLPGGIVAVGLSRQPEAIAIQVQDTGEGISPADLPYIWERFYRGQSRAGGGTGLGLALVKELTEAMGGAVAVTSTPGEGSCFTVTLPRARRDEA